MSTVNLDDIRQTVYYIPSSPPTAEDDREESRGPTSVSSESAGSWPELRLQAYKAAWTKCLDRIKTIIQNLHRPVADGIVQRLHTAYAGVLPSLPYSELPVLCITDPTGGSSFLNYLSIRINSTKGEDDLQDNINGLTSESRQVAYTAHLYPVDCPNLATCMKALITPFVEIPPDGTNSIPKRKATLSLANYDINLLVSWYEAVCDASESSPTLTVFLHDFEQFDSTVVQDMLYICSLQVNRLRLAFVFSLSSPSSPSYLHLTYPQSTLALLRVTDFTIPSGTSVLEEVLLKTFFDIEFEPDIVVGSAIFDFLTDYFLQHNASLDGVLTILQLAHMKHFEEPLTMFIRSTPPHLILKPSATSHPLLKSLLLRVQDPEPPPRAPEEVSAWRGRVSSMLLNSVDVARTDFYARARQMRFGVQLAHLLRQFMTEQGYRSARPGPDRSKVEGQAGLELMSAALKGKLGKDLRYIVLMVKKLPLEKLSDLLHRLHVFFHKIPIHLWAEDSDGPAKVDAYLAALPDFLDGSDDVSRVGDQLAGSLGSWLMDYLEATLSNLEETALWDIWHTGSSPFPAELINPSIRASILSGLLRPHAYVAGDGPATENRPLHEFPDISILFQRYLESGKMINVYDWFDSFMHVLESQRGALAQHDANISGSLRKAKNLDKHKGNESEDVEMDDNWETEVQARFIRALHELDYLGFIKHTGRKPDHVLRTVFDVMD